MNRSQIAVAARASARRMPSADILARYQADARNAARRSGAHPAATDAKLLAVLMAITAPNATSVR